jgi:hypothetical protein
MVGMTTDSDMPTNIRAANNKVILSIKSGVAMVPILHSPMPAAMMYRGENCGWDNNSPAGTIPRPYPTEKKDEMDPLMVSVMAISCDMGTSATDMATRSKEDKDPTKNSSAIMVTTPWGKEDFSSCPILVLKSVGFVAVLIASDFDRTMELGISDSSKARSLEGSGVMFFATRILSASMVAEGRPPPFEEPRQQV